MMSKRVERVLGKMVSTVFGKHNKFPHGNDESLDIKSDKTIVKSSDGDGEGKEEPSGESERKEGRRTYLKYLRKRVGNVGSDGGEADRQWQKAKRGVREMMKGEVWRKMILMRGKCRPLNGSGVIQYDEDGVLIPESHHI
ncbi:hypothetical protein HRI_005038100 [Hibiscus trionum]|uniref:Uncharacterized protein n=1 Tax=Hibiscus trionum TaxID=183268 RepID=A0A9W7MVR5_HIBTR|nr:hypothetical protein HRI_005038100 [Hibiscus trionum]